MILLSMILQTLRRRFAAEAWDDTTEAPGGAEEAHRRWPEGRSEQGASKAKVIPPFGTAGGRSVTRPHGVV